MPTFRHVLSNLNNILSMVEHKPLVISTVVVVVAK